MQISRHWRMNAQRYRLAGVRYPDGQVRFQPKVRREGETAMSCQSRVKIIEGARPALSPERR